MGYLGDLRIETARFDAQIISHLLDCEILTNTFIAHTGLLSGSLGVSPLKKTFFSSQSLGKRKEEGIRNVIAVSMHPDMTDTSGVPGAERQTATERFSEWARAGELSLMTARTYHDRRNGFR
jgi:hypothetical protein